MQTLSPWHKEIMAGCLIGAISFGWYISKKTNMVGGLLVFYIFLNGFQSFFMPKYEVPNMGPLMLTQIPGLSAMALLWVIVLIIPFLMLPKDKNTWVTFFFLTLGYVNSILVIFKLGVDQFKNSGVQFNPAQDGTLIACLLPLAYYLKTRYKWFLLAIMSFAIIRTNASTPFLGLGIFVATTLWFTRFRWLAILGPAVVAGVGVWLQGYQDFVSPNGRTYIWKLCMTYWKDHLNMLFGSGVGTFFLYGPGIEINHHGFGYNQPVYVWLHSSPLQILFELGVIGFLLSMAFYLISLVRCYDRPRLFSMLVIYGVTSCFQMPLNQMFSAFLLIFILKLIYEQGDHDQTKNLHLPLTSNGIN